MRDISAGRDIVNSTIMEIVGNNPSVEILQQPAEELAAAEHSSRIVVRNGRKNRAARAGIFSAIALVSLAATGLLGYYWLLQSGKIAIADLFHDSSNIAMGALVSVLASLAVSLISAALTYHQKDPSDAEVINSQRLRNISIRWNELKLLGFPKSEIKRLRKQK